MLRFEDGARGVVAISQVSAGRKNTVSIEVDGAESALAWYSEDPDRLWIGHRGRPNEILQRDPSLARPEAVAGSSAIPAATSRATRTRSGRSFTEVYADVVEGGRRGEPAYPTFADGHDAVCVTEAVAVSHRRRLGQGRAIRRNDMKLGLLTAPFPRDAADGGGRLGSRQRVRRCWRCAPGRQAEGTARRYAGTCHVDVDGLSEARAKEIVGRTGRQGHRDLRSGLLPQPAPSRPGAPGSGEGPPDEGDHAAPRRWECRWSTLSSGRTRPRPRTRTGRTPRRCGPRSSTMPRDTGVRIAIENCPMIFSKDEWPSGHNLAYSPAIWRTHVRGVRGDRRAQLRPLTPGVADDRHRVGSRRSSASASITSTPRTR